jgi:acyl carrier protein
VTAHAEDLRHFIVDNFLYGDLRIPLEDDDSFSGRGIIDSTGILELVAFVETRFGISIEDEEMIPENFDSLAKLTRYVVRKQTDGSHAG